MHVPLAIVPLANPLFHLLGTLQLWQESPIAPLCPPLQNPNPFLDFPEPNVHLIKARLNPLPSIQNK
jgi:hypothetical protein